MQDESPLFEDFGLDLDAIAPKSLKKSAPALDLARIRSATSLETWLSQASNFPHRLPPTALQLFLTDGDVDFLDALRACLLAAPTVTLDLATVYIGKAHLARLIALHASGAYRSLHLILGACSINTPSCTVGEAETALHASGIPFALDVISHHAKFAVTPQVLLLTSANLNRNPRTENILLTANPATVTSFRHLARDNFGARILRHAASATKEPAQ